MLFLNSDCYALGPRFWREGEHMLADSSLISRAACLMSLVSMVASAMEHNGFTTMSSDLIART